MYNYNKDTCDICNVTKKEYHEKHGTPSYFDKENMWKSFQLDTKGGVLCGHCHKEKQLESLFNLMDRKGRITHERH